MLHSPLKTALAYECFQEQASSTLALPSDHKLKTKGTGKQRVQEQVMMTVKRQKQKSSVSSSVGHSNRGKVPQRGAGLVLWGALVGFVEGGQIAWLLSWVTSGRQCQDLLHWMEGFRTGHTAGWISCFLARAHPGNAALLHIPEALGHSSVVLKPIFPWF